MSANIRRAKTGAIACAALSVVVLAGCGKAESSGSNSNLDSKAGQQVVKPADENGPTCDLSTYGAKKIDLKNAVVGFSQSEKEDNPFRIAETASITDAAKK
ncbi:MAG: hypothetical protein ACR2FG_07325, partial [Marmoricola sp.]